MKAKIFTLYLKAPYMIQYFMINLYGAFLSFNRFGYPYKKYFEYYSLNNPLKIDEKQMRRFIISANKTPFWKKRFKKYKINIESNNLEKEISKLPILTKKEVKINFNSIINKSIKSRVSYVSTSGTTGSSLVFPQTREMEQKQWAIWYRYRSWHNIKLNDWCGWFGGRLIMSQNKDKPPYWYMNYFTRQIMFSCHHLSQNTIHHFYKKLIKSKLKWLHGYPSQITELARLLDKNGLVDFLNVKIISLGSESLLEYQKNIIKKVFLKANIIEHYGLAEGVSNISLTADKKLIADQDFAITNFLEIDKNRYRIIGTNYNNLAFPLIRYDTGDIANGRFEDENFFTILSLDGRKEDSIVLDNGIKLGRLDHIFKNLKDIDEAQIIQKKGKINFLIIKGKDFNTKKTEPKLIFEIHNYLGNNQKFNIKYVEHIEKKSSGKHRFVISDIK